MHLHQQQMVCGHTGGGETLLWGHGSTNGEVQTLLLTDGDQCRISAGCLHPAAV